MGLFKINNLQLLKKWMVWLNKTGQLMGVPKQVFVTPPSIKLMNKMSKI